MKLSQVSFVGTLVMLASAKRICEVYATSTRLLEKTNPTRALESEYPPHVRRPQFAETLVGTTSRAGKSLPALLQRPHRLQSITVVARSPTSGSEEEPALLSPQHSTRKGTAPSDLLTETRHADFRHLNAYDNGLADALEVTIAARNERNYRPGSRRRLPTTVPSVSRFAGSKQAATAQAAVSELTLTPVSGRQELLQLFMDDASDIPRDTWREILLFRLGRVQEAGESDGGATPSTRVRSPVDRADES